MSKHLKRLAAPRAVKLERKVAKWTMKASPGPHPADASVPLGLIVRDYLLLCDTRSEAKKIVSSGAVLIDGVPRKDIKFPCGLMDVVSIPKINKSYRILFDQMGKLTLVPLKKGEEKWKLCRIENKTTIRGGKIQLNLHDGRNLIVEKDEFRTGDAIKLSLKDNKIAEIYKLNSGFTAFITGGAHIGNIARIEGIEVVKSPKPNRVLLSAKNKKFSTIKDYVFPVGKETPVITLPEVKIR